MFNNEWIKPPSVIATFGNQKFSLGQLFDDSIYTNFPQIFDATKILKSFPSLPLPFRGLCLNAYTSQAVNIYQANALTEIMLPQLVYKMTDPPSLTAIIGDGSNGQRRFIGREASRVMASGNVDNILLPEGLNSTGKAIAETCFRLADHLLKSVSLLPNENKYLFPSVTWRMIPGEKQVEHRLNLRTTNRNIQFDINGIQAQSY